MVQRNSVPEICLQGMGKSSDRLEAVVDSMAGIPKHLHRHYRLHDSGVFVLQVSGADDLPQVAGLKGAFLKTKAALAATKESEGEKTRNDHRVVVSREQIESLRIARALLAVVAQDVNAALQAGRATNAELVRQALDSYIVTRPTDANPRCVACKRRSKPSDNQRV